ncbi:MAG: glucose-6-phosphate isomerase [Deltaproteobacteria bacterium]|nr:glucose-6-phosphate isomerase [Deltaproteobacteria bacterium]
MQQTSWQRFKDLFLWDQSQGFGLDISRMNVGQEQLGSYEPMLRDALAEMAELEKGAIANADEGRMVGHYWLRDAGLAPTPQIKSEIENNLQRLKEFVLDVHSGKISAAKGQRFKNLLLIGIGGSALGPQFVRAALGGGADKMRLFFFDNTDPDGMQMVLSSIPCLAETMVVVISKSGGTKETRNGQLIAQAAWRAAGLDFAKACVAVTQAGSALDKTALEEGWLARFPMWDWVGGRTSLWSAVGLLPAALQGMDIDALLSGARQMDQATRVQDCRRNPAALMALMWFISGGGRGEKAMVILPYKDRLELFSRYLQQLVMESLGKREDRSGKVVHQGLVVYGNKGSTDQHAYVQQLRDGLNNFFAVFIEVLTDQLSRSQGESLPQGYVAATEEVEPQATAGDYLSGFYQGTRTALYESDRESLTITVEKLDEASLGRLIALFERAVGLYASLINVNAYHQPGVEAGKLAAGRVLELQMKILSFLDSSAAQSCSVEEVAAGIGAQESTETVFKILRHLAANQRVQHEIGKTIFDDRYRRV